MNQKKVRTQIMLTKALQYQVDAYAKRSNLSFSAAVRELLNKALSSLGDYGEKNSHNPTNFLLELADKAAKIPGKAPKDLSTNDEYLYGEDAP